MTATGSRQLVQRQALALAVAASVAASASGTWSKMLIEAGWSVGAVTLVRTSVSAAVLTPAAAWMIRRRGVRLRGNARAVLLIGSLGTVGIVVCYLQAVSVMSVSIAMMVMYTAPALVLIWVWMRHGERPDRRTALGAATAFIGLVLVVAALGLARPGVQGLAWAFAAAVCLASYFVISGGSNATAPPLVLTWGALVIGSASVGLLAVTAVLPVRFGAAEVRMGQDVVPALLPLALLVLMSSVFAYVASITVVPILGARLASFVSMIELLSGLLVAWAVLGETPSSVQLVGGGLIVVGVLLIRRSDSARIRHAVKADEATDPYLSDPF